MTKEKYYTPEMKEFHPDFKFQYLNANNWHDCILGKNDIDHPELRQYKDDLMKIAHAVCRVKCLDEDDINEEGFIKREKDQWAGWNDFYLDTISGQVGYFLSATLHKPRMDNIYKIYLHRHLAEDTKIEDKLKEGESELVFKGVIKNKSELRRIMEMLQIKP